MYAAINQREIASTYVALGGIFLQLARKWRNFAAPAIFLSSHRAALARRVMAFVAARMLKNENIKHLIFCAINVVAYGDIGERAERRDNRARAVA